LVSYEDKILSARNFLDIYTFESYKGTYKNEKERIDLTALKLKYVQQELDKRGKMILFLLGYTAWEEVYGDKIEPYYRYFEDYYKDDVNRFRATFDGVLHKDDINYFNSRFLLSNNVRQTGIETISFYEAHWNRYGAGLAMMGSLEYLKAKYKTDWGIPKIKAIEYSDTPSRFEANFLYDVHLFPSLANAIKSKRWSFPYIVYEVPQKPFSGKIVLAGDSFTVQYEQQLIDSKFADKKNITEYGNEDDELKSNMKKVIDNNDVIIIMYKESSFYDKRFKTIVDIFYDYLKEDEAASRKQKQK
jgi:hypothetical protein